jgi:hypothetical protein
MTVLSDTYGYTYVSRNAHEKYDRIQSYHKRLSDNLLTMLFYER